MTAVESLETGPPRRRRGKPAGDLQLGRHVDHKRIGILYLLTALLFFASAASKRC